MLHHTFDYFAPAQTHTNRALWWGRQFLWACCWCWFLTSLNTSTALAQDKLEKLKEGEQVEVYFLNEWQPGVVIATDKKGNARVEFEFAAAKQTQDFLRAAIRRPYENGAIVATRTYKDKSGKHSIVAAVIAITDTQVRLRKSDMTEKDMPLTSLSDADQKYLQGLIKKGLAKKKKLPLKRSSSARTWTLSSGETVDGDFVELKGGQVVIRQSDGSQKQLALGMLSPGDRSYAIQKAAAVGLANANSAQGNLNMPGDIGPSDIGSSDDDNLMAGDVDTTEVESQSSAPPAKELKAQLLKDDRWGFEPDAINRAQVVDRIDLGQLQNFPSSVVTSDGRKMLAYSGSGKSEFTLVDLTSGKVSKKTQKVRSIPKAISPSGKYYAGVESPSSNFEWSISETETGKSIWNEWTPYGVGRDVMHSQFLDDEHLVTVSLYGDLGVWSINTKKIVWWIKMRATCIPAVSPGGKYLVIHTDDRLVVLVGATGKVVSQIASNPVGIRILAVDDSCQRLAGIGNGLARFWNLNDGKIVTEFGIASAVLDPSIAIWLTPTQVAVGGTKMQRLMGQFDLVDISISGSASCFFTSSSHESACNGFLPFSSLQGGTSLVLNPKLPSDPMNATAEQFLSNLGINLEPGSPVQIELNAGPNVDRPTELKHLTKLLTKAGFRVVESGGKATFVANMRESKNYNQVDLKDLTDEAFKPTRDLILKQGDAIVWRATKDIFGFEKGNVWSDYVIPSVIRIPKQPAPCFILTGTGEWGRAAAFKRDYSEGIRSSVSVR